MNKLPQDVGLAFERARALYTPSPERLAHVQTRIAHAVETGESAGVDIPQALFVPGPRAPRRHRWGLPYWMALGALVVALGLKSTAGLWDAPLPVQQTQVVAGLPSSPKIESAPATPTEIESASDASLARTAEPLETTAGERRAAPESRPRPSDKRRRALTEESKPASAALSMPSEDPFDATFDLPVPSVPVESRVLPVELQNDPTSSYAARSKVVTGSGTAAPSGVLAAEVKLIAQAQKAIARGELARAQLLLSQHRRDFPAGQLLAERVALEVHAHCKAGDAAGAEQPLRELALLAPDSYLLRSAKQKCGE